MTCTDMGPHSSHLPVCPGRGLDGRLPPEYRCDPSAVSGCKGHLPKERP